MRLRSSAMAYASEALAGLPEPLRIALRWSDTGTGFILLPGCVRMLLDGGVVRVRAM